MHMSVTVVIKMEDGSQIINHRGAGKPQSKENKCKGVNFAQIVRTEFKKALRKHARKNKKRCRNHLDSDSNSNDSS